MGTIGSIGEVTAKFTADTRSYDASVAATGAGLQEAAKKAQAAGESIRQAGAKFDAAARVQGQALDRLRRQWEREQSANRLAMSQASQRAAQVAEQARASELAALKADILARAEEAEGGAAMGAAAAHRELNAAMEGGVPKMAAASGAIRLLEGGMNNNVRAAERFVSTTLGLGPLLEVAFPVVGAIALGSVLIKVAKEAWDAGQNIINLKNAIEGLNETQITVDRTIETAADSAEQQVESILAKTQGEPAALRQKYQYESNKPIDLSSYFYNDAIKKLPNDVKTNYEQLYKSVAPQDLADRLARIRSEVIQLQNAVANGTQFGVSQRSINGFGPDAERDSSSYWKTRLLLATQIQSQLEAKSEERGAGLQATQIDIGSADTQSAKEKQDKMREAARQAQAAQREASEAMIQSWHSQLQDLKSAEDVTRDQEINFWIDRAVWVKQGSQAYRAALMEAEKLIAQTRAENLHGQEAWQKTLETSPAGNAERWDMSRTLRPGSSDQDATGYLKNLNEGIAIRQRNSDAIAEASIKAAVASGQMSRFAAAEATAALHTQQYAEDLDRLKSAMAAIASDPSMTSLDRSRQSSGVQNQIDSLNGARALQIVQDQASFNSQTLSGSIRETMSLYVQQATDAAAQIREIMTSAFESLNSSLASSLLAPSHNGREYRQNIERGLGNSIRGVGSNLLNAGFHQIEGGVLGHFGLGGKAKPTGAPGDPLHVVMDSGLPGAGGGHISALASKLWGGSSTGGSGSSGSSAGRITSGLVSSLFQGFFADGGDVDSGRIAIVGENGPEPFIPRSAGRILPNSSLGGTTHHHYNTTVDARGAHDPAAVEAAVNRGIMKAAPMIVSHSVRAVHEGYRRSPSSRRF